MKWPWLLLDHLFTFITPPGLDKRELHLLNFVIPITQAHSPRCLCFSMLFLCLPFAFVVVVVVVFLWEICNPGWTLSFLQGESAVCATMGRVAGSLVLLGDSTSLRCWGSKTHKHREASQPWQGGRRKKELTDSSGFREDRWEKR